MDMRMEMEILTPSVKHGQEADCRAQMLGVRRDGQQRLGHSPEENAVDYPGILQRQAGDLGCLTVLGVETGRGPICNPISILWRIKNITSE